MVRRNNSFFIYPQTKYSYSVRSVTYVVIRSKIVAPTKNFHSFGVGATIIIPTQLVIISIMTMTTIHVQNHGPVMRAIGLMIDIIIGAIYLLLLVTGALVLLGIDWNFEVICGTTLIIHTTNHLHKEKLKSLSMFGLL